MRLNQELYNDAIELFQSKTFRTIIKKIIKEYKDDSLIEKGFGHTLSRADFTLFDSAVRLSQEDQIESIRSYINKLLFEKSMSQSELSHGSFIKESTLNRYINGSRDIPADMAKRIILSLHLNFEEATLFMRKIGRSFKQTAKDATVIMAINQGIYDIIQVEAVIRHLTNEGDSLYTAREQEELAGNENDWEIEIID